MLDINRLIEKEMYNADILRPSLKSSSSYRGIINKINRFFESRVVTISFALNAMLEGMNDIKKTST